MAERSWLLREAEARTPSGAFQSLLEREINIARGIRTTASESQQHLREFLSGEHGRDANFPRILSIADQDFIGGSFARHVKTWPLDDIDIYFPLDGHGLVYSQQGVRLPYTIASDGVLGTNPLLTPRWMAGQYISSVTLIREFAGVLRRHYREEVEVLPDGQAITIRMKQGETESGDGLGFDVVPCFFMKPDNAQESPFYIIADGAGGWIRTNPRIDQTVSELLHENNGRTFRKAVKLLKFWNTERLDGALPSYYIELAVARAFHARNQEGNTTTSLPFAVALGFWAVNQAVNNGNQESWLASAPPVTPGDLSVVHRAQLSTAAIEAKSAWDKEKSSDLASSIAEWERVFGNKFAPSN